MDDFCIKQAVILAGGRGVRLKPFTDSIPKPMVLVKGRPFLWYLIENLKKNDIKEVVLCVGYLSEKIIEYFGDGSEFDIKIRYSKGDVSMETGERLRNAKELLDDRFVLLYCDNYWPIDLSGMLARYKESGALAMTTVYTNKDGRGEYGVENNIWVDNEGYVVKYDKTRKDKNLNGVDIGFFVIDKKVIDLMFSENPSFETELLPLLSKRRELVTYMTDDRYYYITTKKDLELTGRFLEVFK